MAGFDSLPHQVNLPVSPFQINISDEKLAQLDDLVKATDYDIETYWNTTDDDDYGVTYEWVSNARKVWSEQYQWREREDRINSYPQFMINLTDEYAEVVNTHFMALFSKKDGVLPLACFHGWPGSYLEFVGVCDILMKMYTLETLPYHIIVPSLPGYLFTSGPSTKRRPTLDDSVDLMHRLMNALGFDRTGYVVSGGDVGSYVARIMAVRYAEVKALHLNMSITTKPEGFDDNELEDDERLSLAKGEKFTLTGSGYAIMHGTKPATISTVLQSHPYNLLPWMGEKFCQWAGVPLPLEEMIDQVFLYWVTNSMSRSLWLYTEFFGLTKTGRGPHSVTLHGTPEFYCHKPFGYSFFPAENNAMPKKWVATTGNLVFYNKHSKGGYFAAWENPQGMTDDITEFMALIQK